MLAGADQQVAFDDHRMDAEVGIRHAGNVAAHRERRRDALEMGVERGFEGCRTA
jgi:hypothetical protein